MINIRYAKETDRAFWFCLDRHLPEAEFSGKVRDQMAYVLTLDGQPAGLLRWQLFWDSIPFCTMIQVASLQRGKGCGRKLMEHWEADMKQRGYRLLLISTQVDETAQYFYRKLGYRDCGGLLLDVPGYAQPMELFLLKAL